MHYSFEVRERAKEVASKNNKMLMSTDCNLLNALLFNRTFSIYVILKRVLRLSLLDINVILLKYRFFLKKANLKLTVLYKRH